VKSESPMGRRLGEKFNQTPRSKLKLYLKDNNRKYWFLALAYSDQHKIVNPKRPEYHFSPCPSASRALEPSLAAGCLSGRLVSWPVRCWHLACACATVFLASCILAISTFGAGVSPRVALSVKS